MPSIKRALISVSDKSGIIEFANFLNKKGIEILSTGGTAELLRNNNVDVMEVSDYTEFPEMMNGRVKTLHPKIYGGILGRRGVDNETMEVNGIDEIDMVVVNLYPFEETLADKESSHEDLIEKIDIGGPTMIRAAAKNYNDVAVVIDPKDYNDIKEELEKNEGVLSSKTCFKLARKSFEHSARYDDSIANYFGAKETKKSFGSTFNIQYQLKEQMRYGENPHQNAAFYIQKYPDALSIANARQIQGKELSFNNIADADAALECVRQFNEGPACVIVKHGNPCGVALGKDCLEAYRKAYSTDPESSFGGIIAFNRELEEQTVKEILDQQFVEVIIAPSITDRSVAYLSKKKNIRFLQCGKLEPNNKNDIEIKHVNGGILVQDTNNLLYKHLEIVTDVQPTDSQMQDLLFSWRVAKFVKSNAIVYAKGSMTIGVGAGQMSRVNSARIAAIKAEHAKLEVKKSVMASDAFFPFRDGIDNAAEVGIEAIIQPGGSMKDKEVIAAANEHNIAMVFTGMRHFKH